MITNNTSKRSRLLIIAVLALCSFIFAPQRAYAYGNDFLETQDNYRVYATGADVIHFKVPVYSRGAHNYMLTTSSSGKSEFYFRHNGYAYTIFDIYTSNDECNKDDDYAYGRVTVRADEYGIVEVSNVYNGSRTVIPGGGMQTFSVTKTKEAGNDNDYVTWLEINWYPPESVAGQEFTIHGQAKISRATSGNVIYEKYWDFGSFSGPDPMIDAQLFDPFFYASKDVPVSGFGYAAVPYVLYYDPTSYYTYYGSPSVYDMQRSLKTDKRSDNIYIPTTDTVQTGFKATFTVYRRKSPNVMTTQTTNAVTIPAYHRIYDFQAVEHRDEHDTYTGKNHIVWQVKYPDAVDLVDGDFFEVQRALKSDFSDAQTIEVVPMEKGADKHMYLVEDDSREMLSGNATWDTDEVETHVQTTIKDYALRDANGDTLCIMDITGTSDKLKLPSVPVYYRVRRASASMWGWKGHDFARETVCRKHSFLAPLANTQPDYTLDADYQTNRKVHFLIDIENAETNIGMPAAEDVRLEYKISHLDSVQLTLKPFGQARIRNMFVRVYPYAESGDRYSNYTFDYPKENDTTFLLAQGAAIEILYKDYSQKEISIEGFTLTEPASEVTVYDWDYGFWAELSSSSTNAEIENRLAQVKAHLVDSLRPLMLAKATDGLGRCMWDRSARLVLLKTMDGVTQQIVIPQDSIRRLENGNWQAHYVDAANHACTRYSYAVRIDQSNADLHVSDSVYLQTKGISGPNLYFDEGADILKFDASYKDIGGAHKRGIVLEWTPTNAAVDYYVVTRALHNIYAEHQWDTIYVGTDVMYLDTEANVEDIYDYRVTAVYDCNGRHSEHSATDVGTRSAYGEISGAILMPDNSGMAGVTVALYEDNGAPWGECVTGADGTFHFDTIPYTNSVGRDFTVVPSAKYGTFRFNHTSAATAVVHLSADNAVVTNINFENASTVRLSGRTLYKGSTIPVADARFLLNGEIVRRNGAPLSTGIDGNFELTLTQGQPYTLQIVKDGHRFEGDGILRVEQDKDTFALNKSLDGVRFYDQTKVRLVGRVAGGNDQRDLPEAFGLGTNNLGDDLQLVLQLEGDNVAHFVHDPNDLTRDTVQQTFAHVVYSTDPLNVEPERTVGATSMLMEKKRIIVRPDPTTGEYAVDLYPVKYKVVQASAHGYATLFAAGQGSETFDLTNAPLASFDPKRGMDSVHYNAVYDRIYHTPVQIHMQQILNGLLQDGYGEQKMKVSSFNLHSDEQVELYQKMNDGTILYTLGYPAFCANRKYQFEAQAYEDYYYNNDTELGNLDRVPQRGGSVTIHNGMDGSTVHYSYPLDSEGKNRNIYLTADQLETEFAGTDALHTVSAALEMEGNTVETEVFRAFVTGDRVLEKELQSTEAVISILDIVRDPGGNGSSAWVESGATYTYSYSDSYDIEFGLELTPTWGVSVNAEMGTIAGGATYTGTSMSTNKEFSFAIPISHEITWSDKYSYTFTTSDKISTSSSKNKQGIGSNADVFLGTTTSVLTGKAKSVSVINDTLYQQRQPAIQAGTMRVLAQGVDGTGKPYYLVVGEKVMMGNYVNNTFVYTQYHIWNSILPRLFLERDNLLECFADSAAAQVEADRRGQAVYWYIDSLTAAQAQKPLEVGSWRMITPADDGVYVNRVQAIENIIANWIAVLSKNEEEKIKARYAGQQVGVYSVSYGATYTHSDTYSATYNYSHKPQAMSFGSNAASSAAQVGEKIGKNVISALMSGSLKSASTKLIDSAKGLLKKFGDKDSFSDMITEIESRSAGSSFKMKIAPILDFDMDFKEGQDNTNKKSTGFSIVPDNQGEITVAVYRADLDSVWSNKIDPVTSELGGNMGSKEQQYGSYVFYTQAGSTFCIYEDEDVTQIYNPGTMLNNSTMLIAKPAMSINTYEQTNVLPDQRAKFKLELKNAGEVHYGAANGGMPFLLALSNNSNPHGAKLYVNGAPLAQGIEYFMMPGESVVQTLEVERGDVDDYENLQLMFKVSDCPKNLAFLDLSVHFIPLSCDVQIDMPRQNWVMNTLSQHDSTGYFLPIEISGFDIHHKNFDHIEFQYKLATESEDMWVNQCSFYADETLYEQATGNKAMIENGRIVPFRFYGERDPIEQQYDLRAVSFCRYGSGFVTKASPVISGTKDTRPPRVFGAAQPADAILGVGTDLKLRFNEAIAGNYLDEDNNFQIMGMTNATGITTGTSLHFNEAETSNASTAVSRSLTNSSFSLDMIVRPSEAKGGSLFKTLSASEDYAVSLSYTPNGQLMMLLSSGEQSGLFATAPGALPAGIFSRVVAVYDNEHKTVRFYIGTQPIALSTDYDEQLPADFVMNGSGPFRFGIDGASDMLEARVWLKALTPEEIAATNMKYLTGYERDLLAYYRMNEGHGETVKDRANGATLYLNNTAWNLKKGISLAIKADERAVLEGNLLSRSSIQDESIMLWFKTTTPHGTIFSYPAQQWSVPYGYADGAWHHWVMTVDRTRNNVSLFVDGEMLQSFSATDFAAISGAMYLGGDGFEGNIDDLVFFEQALPKHLIQEFDNYSPTGDEMGIFGYLPFEEQILNPNGVLELVFSPNDQRVIRGPKGNIVDKVIPLITRAEGAASAEAMADKINHAPTRDQGLLTKMMFDWAFNDDELLINLNMPDREINKQTIYITVRDVEDLNGNPMTSPVSWVAFVDRNALKWSEKTLRIVSNYDDTEALQTNIDIINESGRRHQYTIESLPDWLSIDKTYGSLNAKEEMRLTLTFDPEMPVGVYNDHIYLIDEDGLAEPLIIEYTVKANPAYDDVDNDKYPYNMSICGQVKLTKRGEPVFDTDPSDIVYALYRTECVGSAHVAYNTQTNQSELYLTVYGNADMNRKQIHFQLWQASTGKLFDLTSDREILFAHGNVYGCGSDQPVVLSTTGNETQTIELSAGWNWISTNLNLAATKGALNTCMTAANQWKESDVESDAIKNPSMRQFSSYSASQNAFVGTLTNLHFSQMYMLYTADGNTVRIAGERLPQDSMKISLRGDGQWNVLPCLFDKPYPITEALADYYEHATPGDIIKSHTRFATFSADKRWVGDLTALRPGEGYLFRRMGAGTVNVHFYNKSNNSPRRAPAISNPVSGFTNPKAATNMTMIARVEGLDISRSRDLEVFVAGEKAAVAEPIMVGEEAYYFLTIQSDKDGELRFEIDGLCLTAEGGLTASETSGPTAKRSNNAVVYIPDSHRGSLKAPIILRPTDDRPYKIIENDHVLIIRDGKAYNIMGAQVR